MAWVEKDHNDHRVSTPCYVQGRQPADQAAQSHIQPGLECLQRWGNPRQNMWVAVASHVLHLLHTWKELKQQKHQTTQCHKLEIFKLY